MRLAALRSSLRSLHWADELDFVGPRVRTAPWAWMLLMAGLTALASLLPSAQQADTDKAQAQADLKRLQRAVHQQTMAHQALQRQREEDEHRSPTPPLTREAAPHAAQLAQWLGYPWLAVLDRTEEAALQAQALMLSFSLDISSVGAASANAKATGENGPPLRLVSAVRDDASALRWVQAFQSEEDAMPAQLISRDRLTSAFATQAGSYEWRAEALWSGALQP